MSYKSGPEDLQLTFYVDVLRRRWWLVVLAALIGTVGGLAYYKVAHKVYTATASVYVTATSQTANQVANGRTTGAVNLDTEAQVVQSATVAQAAAKLMHSTDSLTQLINRVKVTVPANSQVLAISCQASSPDRAATCAQSFAQAYLTYKSTSTTADAKNQISALKSQISSLERASAKLTVEAASQPGNSSQRASAEEQLSSDHSQLASLNSQVAGLTSSLADPSGGSIISNAIPPQKASSPRLLLIVSSGFLVGLLIGLVVAFVAERRDHQIRGPRDVARFDIPVLMSLPLKQYEPALEIATPRSPGRLFSELAHVLTGSLGAGSHVIAVIGAAAGAGAGFVAANLAAALSRSQPGVTLVCADLEGSVIPGMVGLPPGPGLTDILTNDVPVGKVSNRLPMAPRLELINPGSAAGQQAEELRLDAVEQVLDELRGDAHWIIVESPPVASGPDAYTLAQAADATVLVAEVPAVRTDQVLDAVQHLERTGATVLGTVLLRSPKAPARTFVPSVTAPARAAQEPDARPPVDTSDGANDDTMVIARTDIPAWSEEPSEEAPIPAWSEEPSEEAPIPAWSEEPSEEAPIPAWSEEPSEEAPNSMRGS